MGSGIWGPPPPDMGTWYYREVSVEFSISSVCLTFLRWPDMCNSLDVCARVTWHPSHVAITMFFPRLPHLLRNSGLVGRILRNQQPPPTMWRIKLKSRTGTLAPTRSSCGLCRLSSFLGTAGQLMKLVLARPALSCLHDAMAWRRRLGDAAAAPARAANSMDCEMCAVVGCRLPLSLPKQ